MLAVKKTISIEHAYSRSWYVKANLKSLPESIKGIAPSRSAVNKMVNANNINKGILRGIIAVDPNGLDWSKSIKEHWNSIYHLIPTSGKDFEVGFYYNTEEDAKLFEKKLEDIDAKYLAYIKLNPDEDSEKVAYREKISDIFDLELEKNSIKNGEPLYGKPIDSEAYLVWLYCLNYSHVAKRISDLDNSTKIRFYITDVEETRRLDEVEFNLTSKADELYIKTIADIKTVDSVLKIAAMYNEGMTEVERKKALKGFSVVNPSKFISIVSDKNLQAKVRIEDMIRKGVLKRLSDSAIIVDPNDNSIVIGNSINEAMAYFSEGNTVNKAQASEYITRYKSLK